MFTTIRDIPLIGTQKLVQFGQKQPQQAWIKHPLIPDGENVPTEEALSIMNVVIESGGRIFFGESQRALYFNTNVPDLVRNDGIKTHFLLFCCARYLNAEIKDMSENQAEWSREDWEAYAITIAQQIERGERFDYCIDDDEVKE